MKSIIAILFAGLLACNKKQIYTEPIPAWLESKKSEYASCVCRTAMYKGVYQQQTVYEIRPVDPLCDGVSVIYSADGQPMFNSGDKSQYATYRNDAESPELIWACFKAE